MKTKTQAEEQKPTQAQPVSETPETDAKPVKVNDLFKRTVNGRGPVRTLTMRRVLTRPIKSMGKLKQLAVECQSEIFVMDLPNTSRAGGISHAVVFEAKELVATPEGFQDGDDILVACHAVMSSAIGKAGFASLLRKEDEEGEEVIEKIEGKPLKGVLLGFIAGDIADGKRYRSISVAELE